MYLGLHSMRTNPHSTSHYYRHILLVQLALHLDPDLLRPHSGLVALDTAPQEPQTHLPALTC